MRRIGAINLSTQGYEYVYERGYMDMPRRLDPVYRDWGGTSGIEVYDDDSQYRYAPRDITVRLLYDPRVGGQSVAAAVSDLEDEMEGGNDIAMKGYFGATTGVLGRTCDLIGIDVIGKKSDPLSYLDVKLREKEPFFVGADYSSATGSAGDSIFIPEYGRAYFQRDFGFQPVSRTFFDYSPGFAQYQLPVYDQNPEIGIRKNLKAYSITFLYTEGVGTDPEYAFAMSKLGHFQYWLTKLPTGTLRVGNNNYKAAVENGFQVEQIKGGAVRFTVTFTIF